MAASVHRATVTREQVLAYRVRAQQLADPGPVPIERAAVLDIGVQDTGPDGGRWALAIRGVDLAALPDDALALAWSLRGAPHLYRRADLPQVAAAVQPFSDADAAKRIFDAAKPLKAAGIAPLDALDTVAAQMRRIVTKPMVKGEVSTRLTAALEDPYLRECRPCKAIHAYEQPFRLAALRAGLELQPGTSPPVLQRILGFSGRAEQVPERLDPVRAYLRLLGPATPQHVAGYLDSRVSEVQARWPADAVEVTVAGARRWLLPDDAPALSAGPPAEGSAQPIRLLGPFDLFLQAKDRDLLVGDRAKAKALWPVLGRPGAVLVGAELAGLWRPRQSSGRLTVSIEPWQALRPRVERAIEAEAERLAAFRGVRLAGVEYW